MNKRLWAAVAYLAYGWSAQAQTPPGVEVYGTLPAMSSAALSSDGKLLATLETIDSVQVIIIRNLETNKVRGTRIDTGKARAIKWAGPNHVLAIVSETVKYGRSFHRVESNALAAIDARNDDVQPIQMMGKTEGLDLQVSLSALQTPLWTDDGAVLMSAATRRGPYGHSNDLYRIDSRSGDGPIFARGDMDTNDWIVTPDSKVIARRDGAFILKPPADLTATKGWTPIPVDPKLVPFGYLGLHSTPDTIVVNVTLPSGLEGMRLMSLETGLLGKTLFEHPAVDADTPLVDPYTAIVVGGMYTDDRPEQVFFDQKLQAVLNGAKKALPNSNVAISSWSQDRTKFVIQSESDTDAGTFWLMDIRDGSMKPFGKAYPQIASTAVAPVKPFTYKTRDEKTIQAYLTTPPGSTLARAMPLVVMPHGGPAGRDDASFDWWAQFMATRGYAVVKMNFRGSSGYGEAYIRAGHGEWGRKMQDDVTDGVKHLIENGTADPARICIVGASYGGYAALVGAAFTPDLYRCAVSVAGISDVDEMYKWIVKRYIPGSWPIEYWRTQLNKAEVDLDDISPLNFADNIKADVLLIHGKQDTNVPYKQSEMMDSRLRRARKPVEFVTLEGEDHWLSRSTTRLQMLTAIERFLAKHLSPTALDNTAAAQ
jgi:dienelactone hydrolase